MSFLKVLQILVISGLLAGYSAWSRHHLSEDALDLTDTDGRSDCKIHLVSLAEAKALWRKDSTVFLDVRSRQDYDFGHIRGALSLPWEEFQQRFPGVKPRLREADAIVVYCKSVDCGKSLWAAIRLRAAGLGQVLIYPDGWYQWTDHGLSVTGSSR
jgi:rhodanese-related sulfurtransferase